MVVHFTAYDIKHNPQKVVKPRMENDVFLFSCGFKMGTTMYFMVLAI